MKVPPQIVRRDARQRATRSSQRGFSLLEILVAFTIAALALGMIYQVMGNDARQTGGLAQRQRALALAQSLLAAYTVAPPQDVHDSGESAGYGWRIDSAPYPTPANSSNPQAPHLHELRAQVSWGNDAARSIELRTLRPERLPPPGSLGNAP
ncbi:MAG: prepilin-type N-terminal cleavage/methylation domain-containing protein [Burkholderiaceae bacterium]|jgi:general secretion pathway protein I|nr:prepilin-type N-terminal cleavage/methylation domain-containing protein [Burkholderiaceae bacterium]